jgi:ribosomal protein L16 Arg81 hydroxylase
VMYLPRGLVHDVVAVGKPSLHLTIGVRVRDGMHLLTWLLDQCRDEDPFDLRLPRFANAEERNRHVARLRKHFELLWESDVLQRFFDHRDAHIPARTHFSLPWIGQEPLDHLQDTVRLRMNGTTWRFLRRNGAELAIETDGGTWSLPADAERVLRRVSTGDAVCVRELVAVGGNELAEDRVRYLLASMLRDGLLFIDGE